jgi:hypothetical protein
MTLLKQQIKNAVLEGKELYEIEQRVRLEQKAKKLLETQEEAQAILNRVPNLVKMSVASGNNIVTVMQVKHEEYKGGIMKNVAPFPGNLLGVSRLVFEKLNNLGSIDLVLLHSDEERVYNMVFYFEDCK